MRYMLALVAMTVLAISGCDEMRQNMAVTPDRQGHATGEPGSTLPNAPVAGAGEEYYTMESGDTLSSVAKKFNVDLEHLIRRNDIQHDEQVKPGRQLIVPRTASAPTMSHDQAPAHRGRTTHPTTRSSAP